jgi:hypothetical protein
MDGKKKSPTRLDTKPTPILFVDVTSTTTTTACQRVTPKMDTSFVYRLKARIQSDLQLICPTIPLSPQQHSPVKQFLVLKTRDIYNINTSKIKNHVFLSMFFNPFFYLENLDESISN